MTHVHEWIENQSARGDSEQWGCECGEFSDICHICSEPSGSSLWICEKCLRREETLLDDVTRLRDQWDERDRNREASPMAPKLVRAKSAGGESMDFEDVEGEWLAWHGRWSDFMTPSTEGALADLKRWLTWAVHNPRESGFEAYQADMRRVRASLLRIVGLAPEKVAAQCVWCDGKVVRDRCDARGRAYPDGLRDEVRCTGCGAQWPTEEALRELVQQGLAGLPERAPDALVTLEQARRIWPDVKRNTINQAIKRDRDRAEKHADHVRAFPQLGRARDGLPLYRIRDLEVVARGK